MTRYRPALPLPLLLLSLLMAQASTTPGRALEPCPTGPRPAATLLFPFFEVEAFEGFQPSGKNTLISINNDSEAPVLAHVMVWSKTSGSSSADSPNVDPTPVLDFTLFLEGEGVQSINLQQLLIDGRIPTTGADLSTTSFPNCSRPLTTPDLDEASLAAIFDVLSVWRPIFSPPRPPLLEGFITVDVLNDCSDVLRSPFDDGYFETGGTGLASNANVLWGDYLFIDGNVPSSAFGFPAAAIVADASRFEAGLTESFYQGFASGRLPLNTGFRTRFLKSGALSARTEMILWINPFVDAQGGFNTFFSGLNFSDESGQNVGRGHLYDVPTPLRLDLSRLRVSKPDGSEGLIEIAAGSVSIDVSHDECPVCSPPLITPQQAWVAALFTANGGLSVGLETIQRSGPCDI